MSIHMAESGCGRPMIRKNEFPSHDYRKVNLGELLMAIRNKMRLIERREVKKEKKEEPKDLWDKPMIPAANVSPQVIEVLRTTRFPKLQMPTYTTVTQAAYKYFEEYDRLWKQNRRLNSELVQAFEDRNSAAEIYNRLRREQTEFDDGVRRKRRFANEIRRDFPCPADNCHKSYGSEGSLTQHVKLKHENFYKSGDYEIMLQRLVDQLNEKGCKIEPGVKVEDNLNLKVKKEGSSLKRQLQIKSNVLKIEDPVKKEELPIQKQKKKRMRKRNV